MFDVKRILNESSMIVKGDLKDAILVVNKLVNLVGKKSSKSFGTPNDVLEISSKEGKKFYGVTYIEKGAEDIDSATVLCFNISLSDIDKNKSIKIFNIDIYTPKYSLAHGEDVGFKYSTPKATIDTSSLNIVQTSKVLIDSLTSGIAQVVTGKKSKGELVIEKESEVKNLKEYFAKETRGFVSLMEARGDALVYKEQTYKNIDAFIEAYMEDNKSQTFEEQVDGLFALVGDVYGRMGIMSRLKRMRKIMGIEDQKASSGMDEEESIQVETGKMRSVSKNSGESLIELSEDEKEIIRALLEEHEMLRNPETQFDMIGKSIENIFNPNSPTTGLVVSGTPGVGKTHKLLEMISKLGKKEKEDYVLISGGKITPSELYAKFFENLGKTMIFDDSKIISKSTDSTIIDMIKAAFQVSSGPKKDFFRKISKYDNNTYDPVNGFAQIIFGLIDKEINKKINRGSYDKEVIDIRNDANPIDKFRKAMFFGAGEENPPVNELIAELEDLPIAPVSMSADMWSKSSKEVKRLYSKYAELLNLVWPKQFDLRSKGDEKDVPEKDFVPPTNSDTGNVPMIVFRNVDSDRDLYEKQLALFNYSKGTYVPNEFMYNGQIIIISNEDLEELKEDEHIAAVLTRMEAFNLKMDSEQAKDYVVGVVKKVYVDTGRGMNAAGITISAGEVEVLVEAFEKNIYSKIRLINEINRKTGKNEKEIIFSFRDFSKLCSTYAEEVSKGNSEKEALNISLIKSSTVYSTAFAKMQSTLKSVLGK